MNTVMDQSEGAGLGIIIMILMLEKIGLSRENYQVIDTNSETITRIFLPCDSSIQDNLNDIYKQFALLSQNKKLLCSCRELLHDSLSRTTAVCLR
jgi:hypothetical protein